MTTTDTRATKELFRQWRGGDAEAGQLMAQRFADWYYAIATSRLGERKGREPCEKACARFGDGVVKQTDSRALTKWAHEIINEEIAGAGSRIGDGDEASAYTGNQKPKELLVKARVALPNEVNLVEAVYRNLDAAEVNRLAQPFGGMPIGVLKARYRVKQWLRDNARVPFEVAPDDPVLDRAPLPLYESGRMASPAEEANFEQWMLTDLDLCRDIAEFAQFAIALRGGLPVGAPKGADMGDEASSSFGTKAAVGGVAILGIVGVVVLLVIVAILVAMFAL
jgi:hypothetical protein